MKEFDYDLLEILASESFTLFFLLKLETGTPLYVTDFDHAIYHQGVKYEPIGFSFDGLSGNSGLSVDSLDISIDDTNKQISAILLSEDVRNKWTQLFLGVKNETKQSITSIFRGIIGGWELSGENKAKITLTNELILWNKKTLRNQSSSCPWSYKGPECGYAGSLATCDKSFDDCLAHGMQDNYGGERFLAATMVKEVWWGRTRSYTE